MDGVSLVRMSSFHHVDVVVDFTLCSFSVNLVLRCLRRHKSAVGMDKTKAM